MTGNSRLELVEKQPTMQAIKSQQVEFFLGLVEFIT